MECVTVEEWIVNGDRFSVETDATFIPDQKVIALCATGDGAMARALYIAACSPNRMREVLAFARAHEQLAIANGERAKEEYHRAEAAERQAEALQRVNAELREALKPFAAVEPVSISTSDGHISSNAFRRARALLGGE
jgi:hypothetical protein